MWLVLYPSRFSEPVINKARCKLVWFVFGWTPAESKLCHATNSSNTVPLAGKVSPHNVKISMPCGILWKATLRINQCSPEGGWRRMLFLEGRRERSFEPRDMYCKQVTTLRPSNPRSLRPTQTLEPSDPQALEPLNPRTLRPSDVRTLDAPPPPATFWVTTKKGTLELEQKTATKKGYPEKGTTLPDVSLGSFLLRGCGRAGPRRWR